MSNRYAATGANAAVTSSYITGLDLVGGATSRPEIYYFTASAGAGTLADQSVRVCLMDHTTANTGTTVTPTRLDPAAVSAIATAQENVTSEGTYTAGSEKFDQAIHLRSQAYWWASDPTANLIVPATANNGIGVRTKQASGSYAGAYDQTVHFIGP